MSSWPPPPGSPNPDDPSQGQHPSYGQSGSYGGYQGPPMPPPGSYGSSDQTGHGAGRRASMGARFGGLVVDTVLLGVAGGIVSALTGGYSDDRTCDSNGNCTTSFDLASSLTVDIVFVIVGLLYWGLLVGLTTQTLGHRVAGIRVVDVERGGPIGFGRGVLRWLVMTVTGAICTLGYWSPFFDGERRRGWHDKASGSSVVTAR